MNMSDKFYSVILLGLLFVCLPLSGQTGGSYGAYSPYSVFGLGELSREGTAYNRSMGGTGIASNNRRFLNTMNPAAVSARDSKVEKTDQPLRVVKRRIDTGAGNPEALSRQVVEELAVRIANSRIK